MRKRSPPSRSRPSPSVPHDRDRERRQPYAKEVEDYKHGVVTPPEEQRGQEADPEAARERPRK